jgi:chromosome segregation ATPase
MYFRDAIINDLRQELDSEREMKEQVLKEAHSRIDQYENRLVQMKSEIDSYKQTSEERLQQVNLLQSSNNSEQEEIARKIQDGDYQLQKMKVLYQQLRDEHIKSLTVLKELRTKLDEKEEEVKQKSTEFQNLSDNAQALSHEKRQLEQNALSVKQKAENDDALLREYQEKVCVLEAQIRELTLELKLLKEESIDKVTKLNEQRIADLLAQRSSVFGCLFLIVIFILLITL